MQPSSPQQYIYIYFNQFEMEVCTPPTQCNRLFACCAAPRRNYTNPGLLSSFCLDLGAAFVLRSQNKLTKTKTRKHKELHNTIHVGK